jgi:hypothetical protein
LKHSNATIEKIEGKKAFLVFDDDKRVEIDMSKPQEFDYGYARTGHATQGMTIGRVYTVYKKDDHVTQTNPYVDLSRTKGEAKTYTDDKESLLKKSERSNKKEQAHDIYKDHRNDHDGYGIT